MPDRSSFEKKKTKRIYHVLKDSPAEKVGIGIGDEFVKYVGDIVWNSDTGNTTFDMLIKRKNGKKKLFILKRSSLMKL